MMRKKTPARVFKTEQGRRVYGLMAEYATPGDIFHAAEKTRDAGYRRWDVYSPFPIHGMDEAMGNPPTKLPLVIAVMGLGGAALGYWFQDYVSGTLFPLVVQGKPPAAWEPFVLITFEIGVLLTAFTAILGMLAFNKLPMPYHPLLKKERFLKASDDKFIICIEARDPKFDPAQTRKHLEKAGAVVVEVVEE